jgi:hypothetical protein
MAHTLAQFSETKVTPVQYIWQNSPIGLYNAFPHDNEQKRVNKSVKIFLPFSQLKGICVNLRNPV